MNIPILTVRLQAEQDLVNARGRARQVAGLLGFDVQDQTRIATAVSEIARNAYSYAGGGEIDFEITGTAPMCMLQVRARDRGPGIANLKSILLGQYRSTTGMGIGITGARRLMDQFQIDTDPDVGTTIIFGKILPKTVQENVISRIADITIELARPRTGELFSELQQQNQELLGTLSELTQRQDELSRLNNELEDTNRGVVALYAELDEKAEHLRRADELKSKFLSHISHEFRTPLNSILALSRILLERTDGDLTPEQEKQMMFIRKGAESLTELVNDLLDLAKVESGKVEVHPLEFRLADLLGALRGMLRPLLLNDSVNLVIEDNDTAGVIVSDEGKVAQILRNLVSNALKFTDNGEVRVSVRMDSVTDAVIFSVIDTGIGIPPEHQESIFHEFTQVQNPLQSRVKGTGLGLPLSRKLAELLGGTITLRSEVGIGSSFFLTIPRRFQAVPRHGVPGNYLKREDSVEPGGRVPRRHVLVIDDQEAARYVARNVFQRMSFFVSEASGGAEGLRRAIDERPDLIILDLIMPDISGFEVLEKLKDNEHLRTIPVMIVTSKLLDHTERRWLEERAAAVLSKEALEQSSLQPIVESIMSTI